jgi:hypothetical protein
VLKLVKNGEAKGQAEQVLLDYAIWDDYLAVLTRKNTVFIFQLSMTLSRVSTVLKSRLDKSVRFDFPRFKARFEDTNGTITRLNFVREFASKEIVEGEVSENVEDLDSEECLERYKSH